MIDTTEMENVMKVDNRLKLILGLDRPNSVGDSSLEQYILSPIPIWGVDSAPPPGTFKSSKYFDRIAKSSSDFSSILFADALPLLRKICRQ